MTSSLIGLVVIGEEVDHVNKCDHAAVGEEVVAVVEVAAEFAAEDGFGVFESFFHEGMSDAFAARLASVRG